VPARSDREGASARGVDADLDVKFIGPRVTKRAALSYATVYIDLTDFCIDFHRSLEGCGDFRDLFGGI
jgi:hypothetical protein